MDVHHIYGSIYYLQMRFLTSYEKAQVYTGLQGGHPGEGAVKMKQLYIVTQ